MDVNSQHAAQETVAGTAQWVARWVAQDMDESSRTVRVLVMQASWDFWSFFWLFWIVLVPVALLVWMAFWVLRRYNRDPNSDLKGREKMYGEPELSPKDEPSKDEP